MNTVYSVLESFEKLAYKFLLAILFIPKTIVQIIIDPGWVPGYIRGELKDDKPSFTEYISPVILLLIVALIPALIFNFLPRFGTTLSSPAEQEPTTDRILVFEAETVGKSGSDRIFNVISWYVEKITGRDENGNPLYEEIYRETFNEFTQKTEIQAFGEVQEFDGPIYTSLEYPNPNYNTSKSTFFYEFLEAGDYYINLDVTVFDPRREGGDSLENSYAYMYVSVPASVDQSLTVSKLGSRGGRPSTGGNITDLLRKESTIFLALGLLFPPLLFALATKLFKGEKISENTLRENFYAQCYYFSPLSLAIWATYYAWYFFTPDAFFYRSEATALQFMFLPALLALLWFIGSETQAVAEARGTKSWVAFLIVLICTATIAVAGYLVYLFLQPYSPLKNSLRLLAILSYPLTASALVVAFVIVWFNKRKAENRKASLSEVAVIATPLFVVICAAAIISLMMSPSAEVPIEPTQSAESAQPVSLGAPDVSTATAPPIPTITPSPVPTIPTSTGFYTEEFDGNLESWNPLVTNGLESQVAMGVENGSLVFQLFPHQDAFPWVVFINSAFTYSNVRLEAVSTNSGINANRVSLICHVNDNGWYEFTLSNGGTYAIYAYDAVGALNPGYNLLYNGGTSAIKAGQVTNTYAAACQGNTLTLYANDTELYSFQDTKFNFTEGAIGVGASSPQNSEINVQFDSLTISEP